jgi:hypothetical protein
VPPPHGGDAGAHGLEQAVRRLDHAAHALGQRQVRRVEEVELQRRLLLRLVAWRGHEHAHHLAREPGAQGVAADAHVLGPEPVHGGAQRLHGAGQARRSAEAVPGEQAELVLDVAADGGRAEERAPERDHRARRHAGGERGLGVGAVTLEDGAEHGAVALVDQLVRQVVLERLPPLLRHRRRVAALLPLQLQKVHRLDQARHHHPPVVIVPPETKNPMLASAQPLFMTKEIIHLLNGEVDRSITHQLVFVRSLHVVAVEQARLPCAAVAIASSRSSLLCISLSTLLSPALVFSCGRCRIVGNEGSAGEVYIPRAERRAAQDHSEFA